MKVKNLAEEISLMMLIGTILVGCGRNSQEVNTSQIATISVGQIDPEKLAAFDSVELSWQKEGGDWVSQSVGPNQTIEKKLAVGTYAFKMTYSLNSDLVASTEICSEGPQKQILVAGKNSVTIKVCPTSDPVEGIDGNGASEDASVTINPEFDENGSTQDGNDEASEDNIATLVDKANRSISIIDSISKADRQIEVTTISLISAANALKKYRSVSDEACDSAVDYEYDLLLYTVTRDPNSEDEKSLLETEIFTVSETASEMIYLLCIRYLFN